MNYPYKVTRINHINHLSKMLPLVALLFLIKVSIARAIFPEHQLGNYIIFCALSLVSYLAIVYNYDNTVETLIDREFIKTNNLFGKESIVPIRDITKIIAPSSDCDFSTIVICYNNSAISLKNIDAPIETRNLIMALKREQNLNKAA